MLEGIVAAGDGIYELSEAEMELVNEALAELDQGLVASNDEVRTIFDKYL